MNNVTFLPIVSKKRECGTCTKCCEGWLTAVVNDQPMFPGKPCYLVKEGIGCTDYENRPYSPCITYSCLWIDEIQMPEELKPELSGVIVQKEFMDNIEYINIVKAPENPSTALLSWTVVYCRNNNKNLLWQIDDYRWWLGSDEFCRMMGAMYG